MKKTGYWFGCFVVLISAFSHSQEKVLKNGLRTVFFKSRSPITSAVILIKTGEADTLPYLATITNRMLLRGTEIRNSQQMYRELEVTGGRIGSSTLFSFSSVFLQAPSEHFMGCFDILCESVARASFDSSEIARANEIPAGQDKPYEMNFTRKAFLMDAPLRRKLFSGSELGRDIIQKPVSYSIKQILDFYRSWYRPENMIVAVSGRFNKDAVVKALEAYWKAPGKTVPNGVHTLSTGHPDTSVAILAHQQSKDWIWIGYPAPPFMGSGFEAILLLEMALANGNAAYFPKQVFSDKTMEIDVQSYYQSEPSFGYFGFQISTPPGTGIGVKDQILAELEKIRNRGFPETYFEIGKRRMQSRIAILSQYTIYNAMFATMVGASGNAIVNFPDFEKRIGLLTLQQVNGVAKELFVHPVVVVLQSR